MRPWLGGFIIHGSLSVSSCRLRFMLPLQRAFKRFAFPACSFSLASALPRRPTPFQSMPCASSAAHSHVALPHCRRGRCAARSSTHALTPALRPSTRSASRLVLACPSPHTTLVSSCGAPTALRPWPLAPPPALLPRAMPCLHLMAALSIAHAHRVPLAPRFTATPTAARTLGPCRQVVSPRGLALALNPNPDAQVCQTRQVDARTPIRDVHPPRDDALCRQRLGAPIGRRGARSQFSARRFCAPRPALKLWSARSKLRYRLRLVAF